jgi:hypothetical protein
MTSAFCDFGKTLTQKPTAISEARRPRPAHLADAVRMGSTASPIAGKRMTMPLRNAPPWGEAFIIF